MSKLEKFNPMALGKSLSPHIIIGMNIKHLLPAPVNIIAAQEKLLGERYLLATVSKYDSMICIPQLC